MNALNKTAYSLLAGLALFTLSGCEQPAKTPQWYKAHPDEMNKRWAECKKSGDDTQDCRNAIDAHFQVQQANAPVADFNDLPKVDLFKDKSKE